MIYFREILIVVVFLWVDIKDVEFIYLHFYSISNEKGYFYHLW